MCSIVIVLVSVIILTIVICWRFSSGEKQHWLSALAPLGTYLQGFSAVLLVLLGALKANDIYEGFKTLDKSIQDAKDDVINSQNQISQYQDSLNNLVRDNYLLLKEVRKIVKETKESLEKFRANAEEAKSLLEIKSTISKDAEGKGLEFEFQDSEKINLEYQKLGNSKEDLLRKEILIRNSLVIKSNSSKTNDFYDFDVNANKDGSINIDVYSN